LVSLLLFAALSLPASQAVYAEPAVTVAPPVLSIDNPVATAGFYRLSWHTQDKKVELQEATSPNFQQPSVRYTGHDTASVISGVPNGVWYYRLRVLGDNGAGPWSHSVKVTVAHHSLTRAFMFLALGIVVFLATVVMVVRGAGQSE